MVNDCVVTWLHKAVTEVTHVFGFSEFKLTLQLLLSHVCCIVYDDILCQILCV